MSKRVWNSVVVRATLCAAALGAWACGSGAKAPAPAASESTPAAPAAEAKAEPATAGTLRCGDFLSKAEAEGLGLDVTGYDEDATPRAAGMGVHCLIATLFTGDAYESMIRGMHAHAEKAGLELQEGPSIGGASQWTSLGPMNSVMFQSTNKRFAAQVTDRDKAVVEKVARALLAKMEAR